MKVISSVAVAISMVASPSAFAGPVSLTIQNLSKTKLAVVKTNFCGTLKPTPGDIDAGSTSPTYTTDCNGDSAAYIHYQDGDNKECRFGVSTVYKYTSYLENKGYWDSNVIAQSRNTAVPAQCKIVSKDASKLNDGTLSVTFSMD